jgi:predicted trehalose synthase
MTNPHDTGRFADVTGLAAVSTRTDVVTIVQQMIVDLRAHPQAWENNTLELFLDAYAAGLADHEQPGQPTWRTLAEALVTASGYE